MRRSTPLRRRTPLRPKHWGVRWRKRSRYARRIGDPLWLGIVHELPCRVAVTIPNASPCWGPIEADHAGKKTAMSRKVDDRLTVSLCLRHHQDRHALAGPFKGWTGERMRRWLDEQIAETTALVQARMGRL